MPTHPEVPAAKHAPRVPVAASSERGSVSRSHSECPNGASSFSPGLARQRRDYPGLNEQNSHNPERVASFRPHRNVATTPLGLLNSFDPITQGSSRLRCATARQVATLGWRPESRWDSQTAHACRRSGLSVRSFVNARTLTLFRNHHSDLCRAVCSASSGAFPRLLSGVRGGARARHTGNHRGRTAGETATAGRGLGGIASGRIAKRLGTAADGSSPAADCSVAMRIS